MRATVFIDHEFHRTPDGTVWTKDQFPESFWERYLEVFEQVTVISRMREVAKLDGSWHRLNKSSLLFNPVPNYLGPEQFLSKILSISRVIWNSTSTKNSAMILRTPSTLGMLAAFALTLRRTGYAVEVIGDPWDSFSPGTTTHPLRPIFRRFFSAVLRWQCSHALAASYVTRAALQKRYPLGGMRPTSSYSSILLLPSHFASDARDVSSFNHKPLRIICVGTFNVLYKGQDVLLHAIAKCRDKGLATFVTFIGDGSRRGELQVLATKLGLNSFVEFKGKLSAGDAVRIALDQHDLFVLPSRQEGLPRAMIEAMARGLPCIGSSVGGIPELISPKFIIPPNNPTLLAERIHWIIENPQESANASRSNIQTAQTFLEAQVAGERKAFYKAVCNLFKQE